MNLKRILATGLTALVLACGGDSSTNPTTRPPVTQPPTQPANRAPIIHTQSLPEGNEGEFYSFQISASDPDGDALSYSLPTIDRISSPRWISISNTGLLTGILPEVTKDTNYFVRVQVSDNKPNGTINQGYGLPVQNVSNTHMLTAEDLGKISSVQDSTVIFSDSMSFEEGDILIGGISDQTPYGILWEVTNTSADGREIDTGRASLEHAFKTGYFSFNQALSSRGAELSESAPRGVSKISTPGFEFSYDLVDVVLEERFGSVVVNGTVSFNLTPVLNIDFDEKSIEAKFIIEEEVDIQLSSDLSLFIPAFQLSFPLLNLLPIPVGPFVAITPRIDIVVGVRPARITSLEARVTQNADLRPGLLYENGSWENISSFENSFDPSISRIGNSQEIDFEVYAGPAIKLFLNDYGLITPGVQVGVNGTLRFEKEPNEPWILWGGLNAGIGIDPGRFLKRFIPPYFYPVIEDEKILLRGAPIDSKILFASGPEFLITPEDYHQIYTIGEDGSGMQKLTNCPIICGFQPRGSPNGSKIVFVSDQDGNKEIYTMNLDRTALQRLTNNPNMTSNDDIYPEWSPDGQEFVFISNRSQNVENKSPDLYLMNVDGTNQRKIDIPFGIHGSPRWSPDGDRIVFSSTLHDPGADRDEIYIVNKNGTGLTRVTNSPSFNLSPAFSPDGSRIVFVSLRDGNREIYIVNSDGTNEHRLTNNPGHDVEPSWSLDGNNLVFISNRNGYNQLHVMNPDGSELGKIITKDFYNDSHPSYLIPQ